MTPADELRALAAGLRRPAWLTDAAREAWAVRLEAIAQAIAAHATVPLKEPARIGLMPADYWPCYVEGRGAGAVVASYHRGGAPIAFDVVLHVGGLMSFTAEQVRRQSGNVQSGNVLTLPRRAKPYNGGNDVA